ncbi:MAG: hypothetical protein IT427_20785 [Pirellulales bacterium]|nr:hypothetical protein [Pirellulales bacterium]
MNVDLLAGHAATLFAYIGPGADLGLISSVVGLALTMGASGLFIVLYPFRSLIRRLRGQQKPVADDASSTT